MVVRRGSGLVRKDPEMIFFFFHDRIELASENSVATSCTKQIWISFLLHVLLHIQMAKNCLCESFSQPCHTLTGLHQLVFNFSSFMSSVFNSFLILTCSIQFLQSRLPLLLPPIP